MHYTDLVTEYVTVFWHFQIPTTHPLQPCLENYLPPHPYFFLISSPILVSNNCSIRLGGRRPEGFTRLKYMCGGSSKGSKPLPVINGDSILKKHTLGKKKPCCWGQYPDKACPIMKKTYTYWGQ